MNCFCFVFRRRRKKRSVNNVYRRKRSVLSNDDEISPTGFSGGSLTKVDNSNHSHLEDNSTSDLLEINHLSLRVINVTGLNYTVSGLKHFTSYEIRVKFSSENERSSSEDRFIDVLLDLGVSESFCARKSLQ